MQNPIKRIKDYLDRRFHKYCKYFPAIRCLYPKKYFKTICPNECPIFKSRQKKILDEANRTFKAIKLIPPTKNFKPRPSHEKRLWKNDKKMPRNFKDEDED